MIKKTSWIGLSIGTLVVLLIGAGYLITDNTYYCEERGIVMDCERFSVSGNRCYPNSFDNKGYRDCSSKWVKFKDIKPEIIISGEVIQYKHKLFTINATAKRLESGKYGGKISKLVLIPDNKEFGFEDNQIKDTNYKYIFQSTAPILTDKYGYYLDGETTYSGTPQIKSVNRVGIDVSDVCNNIMNKSNSSVVEFAPDCTFNEYSLVVDTRTYFDEMLNETVEYDIYNHYLEVLFTGMYNSTSGKIFIDPSYEITTFSTSESIDTNVTQENNFTHLTISDVAPYDSLVGYWSFDVNHSERGNVSYDYSSSGNDGSVVGAMYNSSGLYGGAMEFDGSGDWVDCGNDASLDLNDTLTISTWVKFSDATLGTVVSSDLNTGYEIFKWSTTNYFIFRLANNAASQVDSSTGLSQDRWYHVAGTYNGSDLKIYIDGTLNATKTGVFNDSTVDSSGLGIGAPGGYDDYYFNGTIDEVMIFNTSLNSSQILDIYNNQSARFKNPGKQELKQFNISSSNNNRVNVSVEFQRELGSNLSLRLGQWNISYGYNDSLSTDSSDMNYGLVGYWHFDNLSSEGENDTLVYDYSGSGNNGTFNGTMGGAGVYSGGGVFDGVDDLVSTSYGTELDFGSEQSFTISEWIYVKKFVNAAGIFRRRSSKGIIFEIQDTNRLRGYIDGAGGNTGNFYSATNSIQENIWYHVVMVSNGTNIGLYIDGTESGTGADISSIGNMTDSARTIKMGSSVTFFNGSIDEVLIFNRSLSAQEIKQLYIKGRANWEYTEPQNLTASLQNTTFTINTSLTNILPEFTFMSGNGSDTTGNPGFYSPVLLSPVVLSFYNITEIYIDNPPVSTLITPPNAFINRTGIINFNCSGTDNSQLKNVTWYSWNVTGVIINSSSINLTGTSGSVIFTHNFQIEGNYTWNCEVFDNSTANYTDWDTNRTLFIDLSKPYFTHALVNQTLAYLTALSYDINASDGISFGTYAVNDSSFKINSSGSLENNTVLGVSEYFINISINDSVGNINSTILLINVTPIDPTIAISIMPTTTVKYKSETVITGSSCPDQITCNLYRDSIEKVNPENVTLAGGTYVYVYNTTGNVNYTKASVTDTLTVTSAQFGKNLTVWKNASSEVSLSYIDNNGNWWILGDLVVEGNIFGGLRVELETVQAECLSTDQNEFLAWDVIRHTVTASEVLAEKFSINWNKAPKNKINSLTAVSYSGGGVLWAEDYYMRTISYNGTDIIVYDLMPAWTEGDVMTLTINYENC